LEFVSGSKSPHTHFLYIIIINFPPPSYYSFHFKQKSKKFPLKITFSLFLFSFSATSFCRKEKARVSYDHFKLVSFTLFKHFFMIDLLVSFLLRRMERNRRRAASQARVRPEPDIIDRKVWTDDMLRTTRANLGNKWASIRVDARYSLLREWTNRELRVSFLKQLWDGVSFLHSFFTPSLISFTFSF
jgi:hypothetical protein